MNKVRLMVLSLLLVFLLSSSSPVSAQTSPTLRDLLLSWLSANDFDRNGDGKVNSLDFALLAGPPVNPTSTPTPSPNLGYTPAFPGAEGFGAKSVGGRGGKVIEVTNLNDSGPGSLRDCISQSGKRTCVFRVAGTIGVSTQMNITNPYITIAGQTAPAGGITLKSLATNSGNEGPIVPKTHDVIIRYIRVRTGPGAQTNTNFFCCLSGIRMLGDNSNPANFYNIIIDHVSSSWAVDENFTTWFAQSDISLQWSIASEALHDSTHDGGGAGEMHSKGSLIGDHAKRVSVHHNLFAHNDERNPMFKTDTTGEVINNMIYNWQKNTNGGTNFGGSADNSSLKLLSANVIGNYYILGPNCPKDNFNNCVINKGISVGIHDAIDPASRLYAKDNIGPGRPTNTGDDWLAVNGSTSFRSAIPLTDAQSGTVTLDSVTNLKNTLLNTVGASIGLKADGSNFMRRDAVDKRIIAEVNSSSGIIGTAGKIIDCPGRLTWSECSSKNYLSSADYTRWGINDPLDTNEDGWPNLALYPCNSSTDQCSLYTDSDSDGMSDLWETNYFGNLNQGYANGCPSVTDPRCDFDQDGYTDLEEFLNGTNPKVAN